MTDAHVRALIALARAKAAVGDPSLLERLTRWFASPEAITATDLPDDLIAALVADGYTREAAVEAGKLASYPPLSGRTRHGSPGRKDDMTALRRVATEEPGMRAQFVLASAQRLTDADTDGGLSDQLKDEQRFRDMHVALGRKRRQAARQVDEATSRSRDGWLVWVCAEKPEARCKALEGRLFTADNPPGAYPGAVHISCRCSAAPWSGPTPA